LKNPILVPELRDLLHKKKVGILKSFLEDGHPKETAEYIALLDPDEIWRIINLVDKDLRIEIFSYLDMDVQVEMVSGTRKKNITELLMGMNHDDRADLFLNLEKDMVDRLLVLLPLSERADVIKLTSYKEHTAGAIMTTDYATLYENDVVEKAIAKIRREAPSKETIYYIYVVNDEGKLIGFVSLRKLIISRPKKKIGDIMKRDVKFAYTSNDREVVARIIEEYDLLALPIVDEDEKLAGIVTYDDAMDILKEEQTEDLEKLMAISGGVENKAYLDISFITHFRKRAFWVIVLGLVGILTAFIIEFFSSAIEALIVLTFYMPLLNAAGGNTGSQSATVVLRALTLNELVFKDIFKVIKKEFFVSLFLSFCLGTIVFSRVILLTDSSSIPEQFTLMSIAFVISLSLALQVLWATIFGAVIPMIATKLKVDPAVVSSPLLATCVDMGGVVIYFSVARLVLGI